MRLDGRVGWCHVMRSGKWEGTETLPIRCRGRKLRPVEEGGGG